MDKFIKQGGRFIPFKCHNCDMWDNDKDRCSAFVCKKEHDGNCRRIEVPNPNPKVGIDTVLKKKTLTQEDIDGIIKETEIVVMTMFEKTTIVVAKLPNGFVIVESSSCVSPENYDVNMGKEICMKRIENKIWELEGYKLHRGGK